jgi:heme a synthase
MNIIPIAPTTPRWLHYFAFVIAISCFLLLFLGGLVTSNQAGLSVPDWPSSYGWNMFTFPVKGWIGGIVFEHTHRLVASLVGFLILVQACAWQFDFSGFWKKSLWIVLAITSLGLLYDFIVILFQLGVQAGNPIVMNLVVFPIVLCILPLLLMGTVVLTGANRLSGNPKLLLIRRLSWLTLLCVVIQGVLGGLTVLLYLPPLVSSAHAGLAQAVFCLTIGITMITGRNWSFDVAKRSERSRFGLRTLSLVTVVAIFGQLIVGAFMRHTFSGLAIPTFPFTADNALIPEFSSTGVVLNFLHTRIGALVITILMFATARQVFRFHMKERRLMVAMMIALFLLGVQITLGAITIWTHKAVTPTTLHVSCGAAILGTMTYIMILSRHFYSKPSPKIQSELAVSAA